MTKVQAASVRTVGRYVLYDEFAAGGMAKVHFGRIVGSVGFSRIVAIKCLHPMLAGDPSFAAMLGDEARLTGRIRHPNVVAPLDVVSEGGELYLVMEYVHGESLAKLQSAATESRGALPIPIAAAIACGMLHGLHAAHEAKDERGRPLQIVHRDVSPQNVLVCVDGLARVIDFGVAKACRRLQTTRDGQIKGKLAYMAPEQLHGVAVTRTADVYGAAVVLWEALTGMRLFDAETECALVTAVLTKNPEPPSTHSPDVPPALDRVVLRGLSRDPAARFASAREMAAEIERCVPIAAPAQVAEWVEGLHIPTLRQRAALLAALEASPVALPPANAATRRRSTPPPTEAGDAFALGETVPTFPPSGEASSRDEERPTLSEGRSGSESAPTLPRPHAVRGATTAASQTLVSPVRDVAKVKHGPESAVGAVTPADGVAVSVQRELSGLAPVAADAAPPPQRRRLRTWLAVATVPLVLGAFAVVLAARLGATPVAAATAPKVGDTAPPPPLSNLDLPLDARPIGTAPAAEVGSVDRVAAAAERAPAALRPARPVESARATRPNPAAATPKPTAGARRPPTTTSVFDGLPDERQ